MMPAAGIIDAFAYGIALSVPVGPVAMLCIQRGLGGRPWRGFATGVGCASCDLGVCCFTLVGLTAVPIASDGLYRLIEGAGGLLLVGISSIGIRANWKLAAESSLTADSGLFGALGVLSAWAEGFAITIANPLNAASVAVFAASLAAANREAGIDSTITGLAAGVLTWWALLSWSAWKLRRRISDGILRYLKLIISVGLGTAGMFILIRAVV